MPFENNKSSKAAENAVNTILFSKILGGFAILGVGIYIAVQVLEIIYTIIQTPDKVAFMKLFEKAGTEGVKLLLSETGQAIGTSSEAFAYVAIVILLMIAAGLAKRIIAIGASLIDKLEMKYLFQLLVKTNDNEPETETLIRAKPRQDL